MAKAKDVNVLLKTAVEQGNLDTVKCLVNEKGADIHARDKQGQNTLQYAAEREQWGIAKWLISAKSAYMNKQMPILEYVATHGMWDLVRWLGDQKGVSVNIDVPYQCSAKYGTSPETIKIPLLAKAAKCGKWEIVEWLANQKGASVNIDVPDWRGKHGSDAETIKTPLLAYAAEQGKWKIVQWLVDEKGSRINIPVTEYHGTYKRTDTKHTLLTLAAKNGEWDIMVKWLVDNGADVNAAAVAEKTSTPFIAYVIAAGKLEMLQRLVSTKGVDLKVNIKDGRQELSLVAYAIAKGQWGIVQWFIDERMADVNITAREYGHSEAMPLIAYAAKKEGWDMVEWLACKESTNVNVNVHTKEDYSDSMQAIPLIAYAAGKDKWGLVGDLVNIGANVNVNICNKEAYGGYSMNEMPLIMYAVQKGQWEKVIKVWVGLKGIDNIEDDLKILLLKAAAASDGNIEMMKWLVEDKGFDVNVNIRDDYKDIEVPLLVYAAQKGQLTLVQWLVNYKDDIGSDLKILLLQAAASDRNIEMMKWLVDVKGFDVNVNIRDDHKDIAIPLLVYATQKGPIETTKIEDTKVGKEVKSLLSSYAPHKVLALTKNQGHYTNSDFANPSYLVELGELVTLAVPITSNLSEWLNFVSIDGNMSDDQPGSIKAFLREQISAFIRIAAINVSGNDQPHGPSQGAHWVTYVEFHDKKSHTVHIAILNSSDEKYSAGINKVKDLVMEHYLLLHIQPNFETIHMGLQTDNNPSCGIWVLEFLKRICDKVQISMQQEDAVRYLMDYVRSLPDELKDKDKACDEIQLKRKEYGDLLEALRRSTNNTNDAMVDLRDDYKDIEIPLLVYAAQKGQWEIVQWLVNEKRLDTGANIGMSLLQAAATNGKWGIVSWLIERDVDTNVIITYNSTEEPLAVYAAKNNQWEVVRLIDKRGGVEAELVLDMAAINGKWEIMEWLIDEKNVKAELALGAAAINSVWGIVTRLIDERGVDANVIIKNDSSGAKEHLVVYAARNQQWDIVRWLVDKRDIQINDITDIQSVLAYAVKANEWDIVQWVLEEQDVGTNIMLVDIDNCDSYGDKTAHTLLGHAVKNDRWDMVKWLVEQGAGVNINLETEYYPIPLIIYAAQKGMWDMVKLFVEKGADINLKGDINELVPYDYSARGHQRDFSYDSRERFYGDYDDDYYPDHYHSQSSEYKWMRNVSLIYYAATKDKWGMVMCLMEKHDADIKVKVLDDGSERSVLSVASKCAKLEVVKALLAKGADMNHADIVRYIFSLPPTQFTSEVKKIIYLNILSYYGADGLEKFALSCMEAVPDIDVFDILKEGELLYYAETAEKLGGGRNPASIMLQCLQDKSVDTSVLQNKIVPSLKQLCVRTIAKDPEEYFVSLGIAKIYNIKNMTLSDDTEIIVDDIGNMVLGNLQLGYHEEDYI